MQDAGERIIEGVGVAPGVAIGPVFLYAKDGLDDIEHQEIDASEVEIEKTRLERAVVRAEGDLKKIVSVTRDKLGEESAGIFEAQLLMLRDEAVYDAAVKRIEQKRSNADHAVQAVMSRHRQRMRSSDNEYMQERANDLLDVQERIVRHLRRGKLLSTIDKNHIVVAESLTAADVVLFSRRNVLGCATDFGGATSHVSIMARALGVPAIASMHGVTDEVEHGQEIILDGTEGKIILNPGSPTRKRYIERRKRFNRYLIEQKQIVPLPAETLDGHKIKLQANLEFERELPLLAEFGAEGIGLFRTEVLFLMQSHISFSEDEQYRIYKGIIETVAPHETTFRVLDLGGDKMLPMAHREHNPVLGWRGIRVLLDKMDLLEPQLRAILRASAHGPSRILLPMITNVDEISRIREVLERIRNELRAEGVDIAERIPLGIMVEVPAVALMARQFAGEVDFFSLGTNDLTQYVLALDRGNDLVADKYDEFHPAVLMLIKHTIDSAHAAGIPVGICGEMGANAHATPLLVGMGIDDIAASPTYLPAVKQVIRAIDRNRAAALVEEVMQLTTAAAVHEKVDAWMSEVWKEMRPAPAENATEPIPSADVEL